MLARVAWIDQGHAEPRLAGARIDMPVEGLVSEDRGLEIWGWVLGRRIQPRYVLFLTDGHVPTRVRVDQPRPDVAKRFPGVVAARTSGFRGTADLDGRGACAHLVVAAVGQDGTEMPLGAVHAERFWARDPDPSIAELVSIVVVGGPERFVARSLESACSQSYPSCELVVVGPASAGVQQATAQFDARFVSREGSGIGDAYATGIRRTNGDLLVFLQAGQLLRANALARAVAQLMGSPATAAVLRLGAESDADATPALYRRSAIRRARLTAGVDGQSERRLLKQLRAQYLIETLET